MTTSLDRCRVIEGQKYQGVLKDDRIIRRKNERVSHQRIQEENQEATRKKMNLEGT